MLVFPSEHPTTLLPLLRQAASSPLATPLFPLFLSRSTPAPKSLECGPSPSSLPPKAKLPSLLSSFPTLTTGRNFLPSPPFKSSSLSEPEGEEKGGRPKPSELERGAWRHVCRAD